MKKHLLALVALLSFYQAFVKPVLAQQAQEPPTNVAETVRDNGDKALITSPPRADTAAQSDHNFSSENQTLIIRVAEGSVTQEKRLSWRGAQWGLFLFGIVSTFVLTLIAPKATKQATDTAVFESGRSLIVGLIAGVIGLALLLANAAAVHSPIGLLYAPFGAVIALVPLAILVAGWLCGMRVVGDWLAQRMGKPVEGQLFSRITLGLFAFLLLKMLVGGTMLGNAALFFEAMIALLGTGALFITGFGSRPDWLGSRLRGESRWFGGSRF
jgi:hypothetical protein